MSIMLIGKVMQTHILFAKGEGMDCHRIRAELKRMEKSELFKLAWQQKTGWCSVGASECAFIIHYKGFSFCLTELMGQGCSSTLEVEDHTEERRDLTKDQAVIPHLWFPDLI
jgi:hypothetical protein